MGWDICYEDAGNRIIEDRFAGTEAPATEKRGVSFGETREMGRSRSDIACFCGARKTVYWWSASGHGFVKMPCGHRLNWPTLKMIERPAVSK